MQEPTWEPACMEPDELELWRAGKARACQDCPLAFSEEMKAVGRCNGIPAEIVERAIIPLVEELEAPDGRTPIFLPDGTRRPFKPSRPPTPRKEAPVEQPTRIRPEPKSSPRVEALLELAAAAEAAANATAEADIATNALGEADLRLQNALAALAPRKAKKPDTRTTEQRQAAVPPTPDELTPRQQQVLDVVVAYNGDRAAAANTLGVTYQSVDETLVRVASKGKLPVEILSKMPTRLQGMVKESATHAGSSG